MEKVFRIKDLDTGQEFLVDEAAADSMMGGGVVSASRGDGKSPRLVAPPQSSRLTDGSRSLHARVRRVRGHLPADARGILPRARVGRNESRRHTRGSRRRARRGIPDAAEDGGGRDARRATRTKKPFGRNPARWFNKRVAEARASLTSSAAEAPRADGPGYAEDADEDPASRAIRAAAEAAGTTGRERRRGQRRRCT